MSVRPRPSLLRTSLSRLAVAGAATLASVFTIAPAAVAADEPAPSEPTLSEPTQATEQAQQSTPPGAEDTPAEEQPAEEPPAVETPAAEPPAEQASKPAPEAETPTKSARPTGQIAAAVAEDVAYVAQQITVSAKIAEGAYVAEGTTTVGTEFTVAITDLDPIVCTTQASTLVDTESFCLFEDSDGHPTTTLDVPAGASVTVTQTGAAEGLVMPSVNEISRGPVSEGGDNTSTPFTFENFGPAPTTQPDEVETTQGEPIQIDVLANDDSIDPNTTVALGSDFDPETAPDHGTAELVGGSSTRSSKSAVALAIAGGQQILYTPDEGYTGADEFQYSVTNANGTTFGTVSVNVLAADAEPVYGSQKYRIGVQIADGSYVTPGTTTAGSEFAITTTSEDGTSSTFTCTTAPFFLDPIGTDTLCPSNFTAYTAPAGATITIVQTKAAPGLAKSTEAQSIPPCISGESCADKFVEFDNTGLLPVAVDDETSTDEGDPVTIDVLANDDSDDPDTTLSVDTKPGDGKAEVVGAPVADAPSDGPVALAVPSAGTLAIEYIPDAGFSGLDTFDYTVTNSNGTATATVTVEVVDGKVVDKDDDADAVDDAVLPDTGGPQAGLLGVAGLLLAAGGWLTARGRRRNDVHTG
jgi:LPXTG-motif cell wall-anchored protein